MCRKAGRLSCGHDSSLESIKAKKAKLCIFSSDSSERLRKEIEKECEYARLDLKTVTVKADMEEIGRATALKSAVLTVNDEGFAKAMLKALDENAEENVND